jgi:methylated-DNA-[protein]-cysteine S-methyltransferase
MQSVIDTPIGKIGFQTENNFLTAINFLTPSTQIILPQTDFAKKIAKELLTYFSDAKFIFTIPLKPSGTKLQLLTWEMMRKIPAGNTITYGDLAKQCGTHPRVVGNICRRNQIPIIIPCHRIIAAKGFGGFAGKESGKMLEIKKWLLQHEKSPKIKF